MANEVTWLIKGTSVKQREREEGERAEGRERGTEGGQASSQAPVESHWSSRYVGG